MIFTVNNLLAMLAVAIAVALVPVGRRIQNHRARGVFYIAWVILAEALIVSALIYISWFRRDPP